MEAWKKFKITVTTALDSFSPANVRQQWVDTIQAGDTKSYGEYLKDAMAIPEKKINTLTKTKEGLLTMYETSKNKYWSVKNRVISGAPLLGMFVGLAALTVGGGMIAAGYGLADETPASSAANLAVTFAEALNQAGADTLRLHFLK